MTEKKENSKPVNNTKKKAASPKKSDDGKKLKELENTILEQKDKYIRLSAEFDNFRKRTIREKAELTKLAGEVILMKILPVVDDFDRALKHIDEAKDIEAVKEGIRLIHSKLAEYLSQQGIKEIDALNKDFDTDVHEAVTKIPAPEEELKGKIVDVVEKGYFLNEKVIRYSKVVIGE